MPGLLLIDLEKGLRNEVVVPREQDEKGRGGRGEEKEAFFGKGVWVEETPPFGLITDSVLGGLVMPVDDAQIEVGRRVVDGPIITVTVCIMREQNNREKEAATYVRKSW